MDLQPPKLGYCSSFLLYSILKLRLQVSMHTSKFCQWSNDRRVIITACEVSFLIYFHKLLACDDFNSKLSSLVVVHKVP
jgi:hypothetical protein